MNIWLFLILLIFQMSNIAIFFFGFDNIFPKGCKWLIVPLHIAYTYGCYFFTTWAARQSDIMAFIMNNIGPQTLWIFLVPLILCRGTIIGKLYVVMCVNCVTLAINFITNMMMQIINPALEVIMPITAIVQFLLYASCTTTAVLLLRKKPGEFAAKFKVTNFHIICLVLIYVSYLIMMKSIWVPGTAYSFNENLVHNIFAIVQGFCILSIIAALTYAFSMRDKNIRNTYELALAHNIIATGRDYYDKLANMTEQLHILRHDYKLHLTSMQKLLDDGYSADAREYLAKLNEKTSAAVIHNYCDNRVLNALLDSFAERCERESISFTVKIILPPAEIEDYELCVIIGNLLENAITACLRTPEGRRRYIGLSMRPREAHFGIKVENSYDGILKHEGKELYSTKKDGGIGIDSIKSVASRHNGEYAPYWDDVKFSAFVVLKLDEE